MSSIKDYEELIIANNEEVKIDVVKPSNKDEKKRRRKNIGFFVDDVDYLNDADKNKVVCVSCTKQFFAIFFNNYDKDDPIMQEILKSKSYMDYIPKEEIYRCPKCGKIELPSEPQSSKPREKKILGAGIENFPEYVSYLNPDTVRADYIGTANTGKKKQRPKPVFYEESEEEKFARYMNHS